MLKVTAYLHAYVLIGNRNAGAETTIHDLLKRMVASGEWEAEVILSQVYKGWDEQFSLDGVTVTPFSDKRQPVQASYKSNLLMTHLENSPRISMLSRIYRCPSAMVVHNNLDITKGYLAQGTDLAVFNTDWVKQDVTKSWRGKSTVVHPMIDPSRFPYFRKKGEYITLVNLWEGHPTKQGKKYDGKGTAVFYEMASRFPEEKFLGVIGGYGEQDIRTDLPNVTIAPHTSEIARDVYSQSKLILMPSRYESFGRVALEAAGCGVPSVVSTTPGLMEAFGDSGVYAEPDNMDQWETQIRQSLTAWSSTRAQQRKTFLEWVGKQEAEFNAFNRLAVDISQANRMVRGY